MNSPDFFEITITGQLHGFYFVIFKHSFYKRHQAQIVEKKHNLSITKAQILPQDELNKLKFVQKVAKKNILLILSLHLMGFNKMKWGLKGK